jgi:hypothetical protein
MRHQPSRLHVAKRVLGRRGSDRSVERSESTRQALEERTRAQRFDRPVEHSKTLWNGNKITVSDGNLTAYINNAELLACQRSYVRQLHEAGGVGTNTSRSRLAQIRLARREQVKTISRIIAILTHRLKQEEARPEADRENQVIDQMRDLVGDLQRERKHLKGTVRRLLNHCQVQSITLPERITLDDVIALAGAPADEMDRWLKNDFGLLTAAKAARAGMAFDSVAAMASLPAQERLGGASRAVMETLVDARLALPGVSDDGFRDIARDLILKRTPLAALEAMSAHHIPAYRSNLPGQLIDLADRPNDYQLMGSGALATVYRIRCADGQDRVFKEEGNEVPGQGSKAGIPGARRGANLTGRILASSDVARHLGIASAPKAEPVAIRVPGESGVRYGALSTLVKGAMFQSGAGSSATIDLDAEQHRWLAGLSPAELNDVADRFGFVDARLEAPEHQPARLVLTTDQPVQGTEDTPEKLGSVFMTPIDLDSPAIRASASDLGFWSAITGQLDLHAGNIMVERAADGTPHLVSIDNDISSGSRNHHPNAEISEDNPTYRLWQSVVDQIVDVAVQGGQSGPRIPHPDRIGGVQRQAILAMTQDRFNSRYAGKGMTAWQQTAAWREMQALQAKLREIGPDGSPRVPTASVDWVPLDYGKTSAFGLPRAIRRELKTAIMALDESTTHRLFGALGEADRASAWSRVVAIQDELGIEGRIAVVESLDDWSRPDITQRLGLDPASVEQAVRDMHSARDLVEFNNRLAMDWGLPRHLAVVQANSRMHAQGLFDTQVDGPDGPQAKRPSMRAAGVAAYFDRAAILQTALNRKPPSAERKARTTPAPARLARTRAQTRLPRTARGMQEARPKKPSDGIS